MLSVQRVSGRMSKPIVVYWANNTDEWLRAKEPFSLYKNLLAKDSFKNVNISKCPAFRDYMKNIYGIRSIYSYDFYIDENSVKSNTYDQKFFDDKIIIRSVEDKSFSLNPRLLFITEEKSLKMSTGIQPSFENNEINKRCSTVPGTVDIGKWFRELDFAFYLKEEYNDFTIKEEDIYQYVKFDTDKKIIFKQFIPNAFLQKHIDAVLNAKKYRSQNFIALDEYYSMFKNKKNIIKEIKNNLVS